MAKESFFPDSKEPHLHIHSNGVTFTDARHRHKNLVDNSGVRKNAVTEAIDELKYDINYGKVDKDRYESIINWIKKNINTK